MKSEMVAGCELPSNQAYFFYKTWCEVNGYRQPLAHMTFGKNFKRILISKAKTQSVTKTIRGRTVFKDVRRRPEDPQLHAVPDRDYNGMLMS